MRLRGGLLVLAAALAAAPDARAGLYWEAGTRSRFVSVCFVGDAVSSRPDRVQEVLDFIREFEHAANVRFPRSGVTCSAPTRNADDNDFHDGDIRVVLPGTSQPGTGAVPGKGCTMFRKADGTYDGGNEGWGSYSNSPADLEIHRACLYNLKLGDDGAAGRPYLNHTLHEFGHALGLSHEHERRDVDRGLGCSEPGFGGGGTSYLTHYDPYSVMHYQFLSCGLNGNYDRTGLSPLDQLSVHILYPEDDRVAEYVGTTVVPEGARILLQSAWGVRGANLGFAARSFEWRVAGRVRSTSPVLDVALPVGDHAFELRHADFLGRTYTWGGTLRVLPGSAYLEQTAATHAAALPLL